MHLLGRHQLKGGKKYIVPAHDRASKPRPERGLSAGSSVLWAPPAEEQLTTPPRDPGDAQAATEKVLGFRARVPCGPGSFLSGLAREMAVPSPVDRNE